MSVIVDEEATCPHCGGLQVVRVARSVNGGRSAHLRKAILDGTFQRPTCDLCGQSFVVESTFSYLDFTRHHLVVCHPIAAEVDWRHHEDALDALVEEEFTASEVDEVRRLGDGLVGRVVFGLDALREKLLCFDAGLDDRGIEALKLLILRSDKRLLGDTGSRPRLIEVDGGTLRFATAAAEMSVDRAEYETIAAPGGPWTAWLATLDGAYVDLGRLLGRARHGGAGALAN